MHGATWQADTIWSPLGANLLWTLFQPFHVFDLAVLPPCPPARPERAAALAADVAACLGAELGLPATAWTTKDKAARSALAKRMGKEHWLQRMREDRVPPKSRVA